MTSLATIDTTAAIDWYKRNRARSEAIFDLIDPSAYYSRPISLRNPIVFYEGHLPAFSVIAFLRRGLGLPPVDARLEQLFERGIDPETKASAVPRSGASTVWPSREEVRGFARACDEAMLAAIPHVTPASIEGLYTALEHEAMHQETLLYMWHRLPYEQKRGAIRDVRFAAETRELPRNAPPASRLAPRTPETVRIPAGEATLGADRALTVFGWDNEFDRHVVHVPAFDVDVLPVTNANFLEFMNAGGYTNRELWNEEGWTWLQSERIQHPAFWLPPDPSAIDPRPSDIGTWRWRGMFAGEPLRHDSPVYVSHAEASAYARWKGRRLMIEAEWHRAAEGSTSGHFDFAGFDPVPVGSHAPSAAGVYDLVGNGWEWTSTVFAPFDGFVPMRSYPEYSADFFDGRHYVMKGASPATARELTRPSFRNWFRGNYPYVYAKFRTAAD
jgi:ergothioneine biosynthesis protein EgtB